MPSSPTNAPPSASAPPGTTREVLLAFLKLGLTAFGGPVAHLGYFRTEFVERRAWLDERRYADLVALCQFLPGPASSQVGMALGLQRAGWAGALAAWLGFTLPSALALVLFAYGVAEWSALAESGAVRGLKLVAVAVVAQAVWAMGRSFCSERRRAAIACAAALLALAWPGSAVQIGAILLGGLLGHRLLQAPVSGAVVVPPVIERRTGARLLGAFFALLLLLPLAAALWPSLPLQAFTAFFQAGSLVFGGDHVVLPLLQAGVVPPGWVSQEVFLAGYGAAQAVPGPLFTFAAFLGASLPAPWDGWGGGLLMLLAIFLPAFLLVAGALPFWEALRQRAGAQQALAGVNAAVVGVLAAALWQPVARSAIHSGTDLALALAAFALLVAARWSPLRVVLLSASVGWVLF
ncbi:MAG: chromate efflux transporter [Burkholderiales bacterium]|nr:chromate efflux transporter [Burkholderiales bacterium]